MTNKFLLNLLGFNPEVTCRKGRHAIESIVSRLCLASLICLCMLTVGVGNVWGATFTKITSLSDLTTGDYVIVGQQGSSSWGKLVYGSLSSGKLTYSTDYSSLPSSITTTTANEIWHLTVSGTGTTRTVTIYNAGQKKYLKGNGSLSFQNDAENWTAAYSSGFRLLGTKANNYLGVNKDYNYWRDYASSTLYNSNTYCLTLYKAPSGFALTFKETGGSSNGSGLAAANATSMTISTAPTPATGKMVEGYYAENTLTTKVANADGSWAANNITGWVTSGKFTKGTAADLYIKWTDLVTTLTLDKGTDGTTDGTATITYNATSFTSKTDATKTGYHLSGYYTASSGGNKVINADGALVSSLSGWTSSGKWVKNATTEKLYAQWTIDDYTVSWSVNGNSWSTGVSSSNNHANYNNKITAMPTAPTSSNCDNTKVFVGWTATPIVGTQNTPPSDLFTAVEGSPKITQNTTFYAVFATNATTATRVTATNSITSGDRIAICNDKDSYILLSTFATAQSQPSENGSGEISISNANQQWLLNGDNTNGYTLTNGTIRMGSSGSSSGSSVSNNANRTLWTFTTSNVNSNCLAMTNKSSGYRLEYSGGWVHYNSTNASWTSLKIYKVNYTNYATSCCTKLGSINGSISLTQGGNSVTISGWSDVSNVGTYTVKMYKKNGGGTWDPVSGTTSGGSAGTQGTRTGITGASKSVTYTGLEVESEYKFTVQAIAGSASYCDGDETEVTTINSTSVSSTPFKFRYAIYIDDGTNDNYEYHYITPTGNTDEGSVDIDLTAHITSYQFKIAGGFSGWWGQTGTSNIPANTKWTLNGSNNVKLNTGAGGTYTFTVDYSGTTNPGVTVTFPSADQVAGYKIYFDKSIIDGWGNTLKYRIGNNTHNQNQDFTLVTGTDNFYVTTTPSYGSMDAWQIANNVAWTPGNPGEYDANHGIYNYHHGDANDITKATVYFDYVVEGDITMVPSSKKNTENSCDFWYVTKTDGMLTHTATITPPSNGTINLAYTNTSGTSCPTNTSTVADLAHRTILTATATPATGYQLSTFTVTPSGESAQNISSGDNHILAKDATFAATFSAKTYSISLDRNGGTTGATGVTMTYNSSSFIGWSAPTRTGYTFDGYYTSETDDNGSGTLVINSSGVLQANVDGYTGANGIWTKDATCTLYAKWTANTTTVTLTAGTGTNGSASIKYDATSYESFSAAVRVGYTCTGYWTNSGGTGTKILNANGSFAASTISGYVTSDKWSYTTASTLTLYAGWTNTYGGDEFELVLDLSELSAGKKIVILDKDYATAISTTQQSNNRASVAAGAADNAGFAMSEGNTVVTLGTATTVQVITLESTGTANRYYMNVENGYFYAPGTSTNYLLRTRANNSSYADQGQFNFALSNGDFTISAQSSTNKYLRKNTSSALFSCYANAGDQKAVLVYVKRESCDAPGTALSLSASSTNISTATGYNTSTLSTTGGNGGTVYYRVTSSNKATATIDGTSFSASAAGTYTVMAYQLKNGSKCRQISTVDITVTTPTLTVNKTSYDFGKKATGGTYTNSSITITGANLVGDISLSGVSGALSVSPTSVTASSAMAGAQTITITWEPTTAGALNQTLTFSSTGAADKTVTITGTGADYYNVTWNISGDDPIVTPVESGTKPTFPTPSPTSCDGTSTTFIGWTQTKWTGKLTQTQIDAKTAADVKVYKSSSDLPTVSAAIDYYAVWAKQETESDEIVSSLTATALSVSNSTTWVTINSLDAPTTDATYKIYSMGTYKAGTSPKQYETYVMKWSATNGYLQTNSVPSSGNKLLSVTVQTQTGIGNKSVGVYGSNNGSDWTSCGSLTATEAGGTYEFTSSYTWIKLTGAASSSLLESVTITYGSYSDYLTTCCESSGLEFTTTAQEVIREDLGGNKATHKVIYFPYTTSSGGTLSAEVKRMSTYGSRDEAAAGYSASTYTSVEVDETNNRVVLEVWSVNDPTTSGQWTYRVKLHQDATDALSGNYCATDDYSFVDVILRDKFVDAVNGNATINRDGKGVALNTPAESDMDVEKDDDCGGQTRRLLGWIRETDLETIYGSPGETGYLEGAAAYEANKDKIVAPGSGSFITTGCTWYAVWGVDNTPEP